MESKTPAAKAPIAVESPPNSINNAEPNTTNKAAAVMISRILVPASNLNSGLSNQRPATTKAATDNPAMPNCCHSGVLSAVETASAGAKKVTTASNGTINKSSNNKMETIFCPRGLAISPRSLNTCITIAVEVITKPLAPTKETCHE